jgi:uncharacterized protein (DUF1778 family)
MSTFNPTAYKNEFREQKYDRMELALPKGKKDVIKAAATARGESITAFINRAIDTELAKND